MSWLLVALIPGLLMLAAAGLERIENGLDADTVTAADVVEFLEQADTGEMSTLARAGMGEALDCLHRRRAELDWGASAPPVVSEGGRTHSGVNPQFRPPRHANRV